ncbi:MAG TPA: hypothetical protein VK871_14915 [Candidatus Limnocylindrales bacterium]|nr:hypothetical protein [Candidatus Limnocylindrales bacterium]
MTALGGGSMPLAGGDLGPWLAVVLLGGFHGLNPAMGWLVAVWRGTQGRGVPTILGSIGLVAIGHALAVGAFVALFALGETAVPVELLRVAVAVVLVGAGGLALARRLHVRWVGMRIGRRALVAWSFLVSAAHGAGLMLVAVMATAPTTAATAATVGGTMAFFCPIPLPASVSPVIGGVAAVAVHALAMLAVMGVVAIGVHRVLGVGILRTAWLDVDRVWAVALLAAGALMLLG